VQKGGRVPIVAAVAEKNLDRLGHWKSPLAMPRVSPNELNRQIAKWLLQLRGGRCTLTVRRTASNPLAEIRQLQSSAIAPRHTAAPLWDELFPAEQARVVRLLVERVDLAQDGMQVRLRAEGLQTLVAELRRREAA
jgi:hypothetical protein